VYNKLASIVADTSNMTHSSFPGVKVTGNDGPTTQVHNIVVNCIKINHCFISLKKIELLHGRHRGLLIMRNFIYREPTKHLWIGYAKNETTDLMAENGTCVVGPSLPVTFTPGNEECVTYNILLYIFYKLSTCWH
jgi:hypothetical protein